MATNFGANLPVQLQIDLKFLQERIVHQITLHHESVEKVIAAKLEDAIDSYDFEEIIGEAVAKALSAAVKSYFGFGEGHKVISALVQNALDSAFDRT